MSPVTKYRSIDETPDANWRAPGDPELYRALAALWRTARQLHPWQFPVGVYRHRTIEDMDRQREEWRAQRIRAANGAG
jgi:hypothetical protein